MIHGVSTRIKGPNLLEGDKEDDEPSREMKLAAMGRWPEFKTHLDRHCGLAVRHLLRDGKVRGSIPGQVKPRTLKLIRLVSGMMDLVLSLVTRCQNNVTGCG
ncbi:hypothetical protein ElyMa_005521900 [Elysia marginata]|uniref:Uncharacterized protein n=1 Tax=Elysia marginata TaxID=1093978 RepID=A0AAV4EWP3_9GAST|nr:hypothetical protein ElyMa_005521900 [Elysia marginata]